MEIYKSIAAIMSEMGAIGKNNKNRVQGWSFRGIDDVYNALAPLLAKHGVFTVPVVEEIKKEEKKTNKGGVLAFVTLKVRYKIFASDGSSIESVIYGEAMDSGDKAVNKALSIAHKYLFFQLFSIPTEEVRESDPDNYHLKKGEEVTANVMQTAQKKIDPRINEYNKICKDLDVIQAKLDPEDYEFFVKDSLKGNGRSKISKLSFNDMKVVGTIVEKMKNKINEVG